MYINSYIKYISFSNVRWLMLKLYPLREFLKHTLKFQHFFLYLIFCYKGRKKKPKPCYIFLCSVLVSLSKCYSKSQNGTQELKWYIWA